jgi:hypothetical protein
MFLAACSGVSKSPPGARSSAASVSPVPAPAAADLATTADAAPATESPQSDSGAVAKEAEPPALPSVVFEGTAASTAEWTLEAKGFPAVSADGKLIALAFGELGTTGPPVLSLTVQIRSIDSGAIARAASFRRAYTGELAQSELEAVRTRLREWVARENAELRLVELIPLAALEERDPCAAGEDGVQKFGLPPLDVTLKNTRLVIRYAGAGTISDKNHPDWIARDKNNRFGNCEYRPVLNGMFADRARRALVIRADYCSPGDQCQEGVIPKFSVHRLPAAK